MVICERGQGLGLGCACKKKLETRGHGRGNKRNGMDELGWKRTSVPSSVAGFGFGRKWLDIVAVCNMWRFLSSHISVVAGKEVGDFFALCGFVGAVQSGEGRMVDGFGRIEKFGVS